MGWEITYRLCSQQRLTNNISIHELKVKKGGPKTSVDVLNVNSFLFNPNVFSNTNISQTQIML